MIKKIIFLSCVLANYTWALPGFKPIEELKSINTSLKNQKGSVNFSGLWTGSCDFVSAPDLQIKQEGNQLTLIEDGAEERYVIGQINTSTSTELNGVSFRSNYVNLDTEKQALIFVNSSSFSNSEIKFISYYNKVTMVLNGNKLITKGQYVQSDEQVGDLQQETQSCVFKRKK